MKLHKYICPNCKSKDGVDILYGMPSSELIEKAERGEIALGGCVIEENKPDRRCLKCEHEWQINPR
jgi:Zn finger protein HypA/HybF involved in hydrogenase expression